jgi:transposase InsO family protein
MRTRFSTPPQSIFVEIVQRQTGDARALRAVLAAARLLGLACGVRLTRVATRGESTALIGELRLALARAEQEIALLTERLERIAARHRPHYTPPDRFRVLELMHLHGWTAEETARRFLVTPATITRWQQDVAVQRDAETVGALVRPQPPVRRFADCVRRLIQLMDRAGVGGNALIARTLARAGWRLSPETVRRIRREPPVPPPRATPAGPLTARCPNHAWLMDVTDIPGLFRLVTFKLAVVFDAYARLPLAARVFWRAPSAAEIVRLFQRVVARYGPPRHLVTDRGAQFTAVQFRRALHVRGIRQRFGAVGRVASIALLERFWRTLKDVSRVRERPPLTARQLEARLSLVLTWYARYRPHTALDDATPAETYGLHLKATATLRAPPRGRRGEGPSQPPWTVAFLDPDRTLPILIDRAA